MSRIDRPGAGGPPPISSPETAENIKETSASGPQASSAADSNSTIAKPVADRIAAGDLKATGQRLQAELQKELASKKPNFDKEKEMAQQLAQNLPRFAPPYVPVGPVVMGDNISAPGPTLSHPLNELNLRADQFQFNDQGNLVITNEKLIEFFKGLKAAGGDVRLGFTKLKPPGEE